MNETQDKPLDGKALSDEALDEVVGGFNPFSPEDNCKGCERELGDTYRVVKVRGRKFYYCEDCYKKYQAGELSPYIF